MPRRRFLLTAESATIDRALAELRAELEIREDFPSDVLAEAQDAAAQELPAPGSLPEHGRPSSAPVDMRELPFVTVDPPSSMDLDQAAYLTRGSDAGEAGYTIYYAIACLAFMVRPDGPLDTEVRERGTSIYGPGHVIALHPEAISADAASLLPGEDRLAYVWQIGLDAEGAMTSYSVRPALVRSRAKLSYTDVQRALDGAGELEGEVPADFPQLLERIGQLRIAREAARGGVSLDIPEQEVAESPDGYVLSYRANLPVESYNAQLSLATGIAAARIMRRAGTGILRTLPPAEERDLRRLPRVCGRRHPRRGRRGNRATGGVPPARRHRGGIRPRHRTAAPARGPLRPGDLRRRLRGRADCAVGGRGARGPARHHGAHEPARQPL